MDISIILATYYPVWEKTKATLVSTLQQKGINYEVIICDDGSKNDLFDKIQEFMQQHNFNQYQLIKHKKNVGTIQNIIDGIIQANGKYVFITSPGDLLFDDYTMRDFYNEAERFHIKIMFGDAVYYTYNKELNTIQITDRSDPSKPELYKNDNLISREKVAMLFGNKILGASYFREREAALKYIRCALESGGKYLEDTSSSMWALFDSVGIRYFKRKIVWYEYGTGVSTNGNDQWKQVLIGETQNCIRQIAKKYPDDATVQLALFDYENRDKNKWFHKFVRLMKYPLVTIQIVTNKFKRKNIVEYLDEDLNRLSCLLNWDDTE